MAHAWVEDLRERIGYVARWDERIHRSDWYQGLDIETQDDVAGIMLDIGYLTQKLHEEADKLRKFLH